jgi:hypothetical protein
LKEALIAEEKSDTEYVAGLVEEIKMHGSSVESRVQGQRMLVEQNIKKLEEKKEKMEMKIAVIHKQQVHLKSEIKHYTQFIVKKRTDFEATIQDDRYMVDFFEFERKKANQRYNEMLQARK